MRLEMSVQTCPNEAALVNGHDKTPDVACQARRRAKQLEIWVKLKDRSQKLPPTLSLLDVQSFLLYALFGTKVTPRPKCLYVKPWRFVSQVNVAVVADECRHHFEDYQWQFLMNSGFRMFDVVVDTGIDGTAQDQQSNGSVDKNRKVSHDGSCGCLDSFWKRFFTIPTSLEQVVLEQTRNLAARQQNSCSPSPPAGFARTDFVLTVAEMLQDGFPLPTYLEPVDPADFSSLSSSTSSLFFDTFRFSRREYGALADSSPLFAIDCEMCITVGGCHDVTRVSIVDECYRVILDSLVKPEKPIVDYVTRYSGITPDMMTDVETTLGDIHRALECLLPSDAILVGHSLNFDLGALKLYHPYTMDTSVSFNLSGRRQLRSSLQTLAYAFLGESIQEYTGGHCSVEDAVATMKLMQLKMSNGYRYGNVHLGWPRLEQITNSDSRQSLLTSKKKKKKRSLAILNDDFSEVASKTMKKDVDVTGVRCMDCAENVRPNCLNPQCLCRQVVREYRCSKCCKQLVLRLGQSDDKINLGSDGSEDVNLRTAYQSFISACRLDTLLKQEKKANFLLTEVLEKHQKRCFVLSSGEPSSSCAVCTSAAGHSSACKHSHVTCQNSRVESFLERLLEFDLNIVELTSHDHSRAVLDETIQRLIKASSIASLVCVLFVRNGTSKLLVKIVR